MTAPALSVTWVRQFLGVAILVGVAPGWSWSQETERQFYADGKAVTVTIQNNRIGVLLREDAENPRELIDAAAKKLGLVVTSFDADGISVLSADKDVPTIQLERLARSLTEATVQQPNPNNPNPKNPNDSPIRHAGVLGLTEGLEQPFLVTSEFVVQFKRGVAAAAAAQIIDQENVEVVRHVPFGRAPYLLRVTNQTKGGVFETANRFHGMPNVEYAHPNFVHEIESYETVPNDPRFGAQWPHRNIGQNSGVSDADIDTALAWDITTGDENLIIAVIDDGFDITHEDLIPNLWINPGETDADGIDNDVNSLTDDVHGWNFFANSQDLSGGDHGNKVAGCVGARGNNSLGVSGTCQGCQMMLLVHPNRGDDYSMAATFAYATDVGASIINCSWGFPTNFPITTVISQAIDDAATIGRGGKGAIVLFAVRNKHADTCDPSKPTQLSGLPKVIGVSGASNCDRFVNTGYGNCVDLLGPTWERSFGVNVDTAKISTSGVGPKHYVETFRGNSAATPFVAGIAGLVIDVAPELSRIQVQRLLQDTTDRVEDSLAHYRDVNGFSAPPSGIATHAFGRANAYEAVRVVAPTSDGGRGGVDVFLRDNRLDWGNTEQPSNVRFESTSPCGLRRTIPHGNCLDIKVDAPPFQPPPTNSAQFDALIDESPVAGTPNRVFVRVRNRGPVTANTVKLKLLSTLSGGTLPPLPGDFWTAFPGDSASPGSWQPIATVTLEHLNYSGASVAGTTLDDARIAMLDWLVPPATATPPPWPTRCLLAILDSAQDPVSPASTASLIVDDITPNDNNVAYRNVILAFAAATD